MKVQSPSWSWTKSIISLRRSYATGSASNASPGLDRGGVSEKMGQLNDRKQAKRKNQRSRSTLSIPGFGVLKPSAWS